MGETKVEPISCTSSGINVDQYVFVGQGVFEGDVVTLDGSESYDPDGEIDLFEWEQTAGVPEVTLEDVSEGVVKFTAPLDIADSQPVDLTFTLTVEDDDDAIRSDDIVITIKKLSFAEAGNSRVETEGTTVILDGSSSYDPYGQIKSYKWEQTAGLPLVEIINPYKAKASFEAPDVSGSTRVELTFELTIIDSDDVTGDPRC